MSDLLKSDLGPLSTCEFAVLMSLRIRAGEKGYCWPTQKTVAREARLSERKVRDCIRNLERLGWISVRERGENRRSNVYYIAAGLLHPSELGLGAGTAKSNTGKSRQESGTRCRQIEAGGAARKNEGKIEETDSGGPMTVEPQPPRSTDERYCKPMELRDLIDGLGKRRG